jgi:hypothetical protein
MHRKPARACMCVCMRAHLPAHTHARAQTLSVIKARISAEMEEHLGEDAWAAQLLSRILQVMPPIDRARASVCLSRVHCTHLASVLLCVLSRHTCIGHGISALVIILLLAMGFLPFPERLPTALAARIPSQRISP